MNIVHIYKDYAPVLGGIENHVRDLAEAQARRGHRVAVLVAQQQGLPPSDETVNGVRVVKARRQLNIQSAPIALSFVRDVARLTQGADLAHLHAPYPIGEAANLLAGRARKTVITWHSDIVRQRTLLRVYAPLLRRVLHRADRILPTSPAYARTSPWLAPHLDKCSPAPLGIDPARFAANEAIRARAAALRQGWLAHAGLDPTSDVLVLIGVGRLRYYKGHDVTLRALTMLPNVIAVIAGNGPMEGAWRALARELGVAQRAIFAGSPGDDALPAFLHAADIYACPSTSRAEAFGIALLEGMACGLPAVSTEVGSGTSWVNQDGVSGRVVAPNDPVAFAAAVEALRDPAVRRTLGTAARDRVAAEFTTERMVAAVEAVYQDVTGARPGHGRGATRMRPGHARGATGARPGPSRHQLAPNPHP